MDPKFFLPVTVRERKNSENKETNANIVEPFKFCQTLDENVPS